MPTYTFKNDAFGAKTSTGTSINSRYPILPPSEKGVMVCGSTKSGVAKDTLIQLLSGDMSEFVATVGSVTECPEGYYGAQQFYANGGRYLDVVVPSMVGTTPTVAEFNAAAVEAAVESSDATILFLPKPLTLTADGYGGDDAQDIDKNWIDFVDSIPHGRIHYPAGVAYDLSYSEAIDYVTNALSGVNKQSQQAAMIWPWVSVANPSGGLTWCDPCSSVAGLYARVARQHPLEVAKAPAGAKADFHLKGVSGLQTNVFRLSDNVKKSLQAAHINPLFSNNGIYVYGASTLLEDTEDVFRHINISRLHSYVRQQVAIIGDNFIFDGINDFTLDSLKSKVEAFGKVLSSKGMLAVKGQTSGVADGDLWQVGVLVNSENSAQVDVTVNYAPVYPAEFISFTVTVKLD